MRGHVTDTAAVVRVGDAVTVATRPERLEVVAAESGPAPAGTTQIRGRVQQGTYLGDQTEYRVETEDAGELIVRHQNAAGAGGAPGVGPGDPVIVRWQEEANLILAG
jgi:ABC-type Fe3+/spermidine/putrescine transport system ATPase subunit